VGGEVNRCWRKGECFGEIGVRLGCVLRFVWVN